MTTAPIEFWKRANTAYLTAQHDLPVDPDAAASRAYYAAYYAVSALFSAHGRFFSKHTDIEAAVHRELVKPGLWPQQVGQGFSMLARLRRRGDYGGDKHVSMEEAEQATGLAKAVMDAVYKSNPDVAANEQTG